MSPSIVAGGSVVETVWAIPEVREFAVKTLGVETEDAAKHALSHGFQQLVDAADADILAWLRYFKGEEELSKRFIFCLCTLFLGIIVVCTILICTVSCSSLYLCV